MSVQLGAALVDRHDFSNRDNPTQNRTDGRPAQAVATHSAGSKKYDWLNECDGHRESVSIIPTE